MPSIWLLLSLSPYLTHILAVPQYMNGWHPGMPIDLNNPPWPTSESQIGGASANDDVPVVDQPVQDTPPPASTSTPPTSVRGSVSSTPPTNDGSANGGGGIIPISSNVPVRQSGVPNSSGNIPSGGGGGGSSSNSSSSGQAAAAAGGPVGQPVCDSTSTVTQNGYLVMANIWDQGAGGGGHQCAQALSGGSPGGVAWSTEWSWNANSIVSFAQAWDQSKVPCGPISNVGSLPSTFDWSYSSESIVADVAYDIMTGPGGCTPVGHHDYEIMIWLAQYGGLLPIGNQNPAVGSFTDASGNSFDIFKGDNPGRINNVYSFVPKGGPIKSFRGDIKEFLQHITTLDSAFSSSSLQSIQAGTEAQSGSATFTCNDFSIGGGGGGGQPATS